MAGSSTTKKRKRARVPVGAPAESSPEPSAKKAPATPEPGGITVRVVDESVPVVSMANGPVFHLGTVYHFAPGELPGQILERIKASPVLSIEGA